MSKASDILNKPKVTVSDILENKRIDESSASDARIVTGVTDAVARYRSTQKLEYRMNLLMTAVAYAAAAGLKEESDRNRLISIASSMNREYGTIKEFSDMNSLLTNIYNKVR